ncbi:unnamed protein product [Rotaria sp. Silwood2]|nr:unnamed protein product [Rotaria sp. Silwood2]CAF2521658.1 unnamed protein product [Rotaria sp. Silwood2]CAF2780058.1 unnamed protein product [Rotaria sp. Silwood2]CAF2954155.1 unnamed protein product [Rotaria sp. Silwood2]CAF3901541.1 unnamed protein product [Rotaria sp. Silwood2]
MMTTASDVHDTHWHWLDGSTVDDSVIKWCPNSTYEVAIGAHCAAYDGTLQCVTNYLCSTLLPAPCVIATYGMKKETKNTLSGRLSGTDVCANSYGGVYANWWTYSILLLNWLILFCFILYLSNHFNINKFTVILTISIIILSFMLIIAFAILWGVQYQDIIQIPLIIVILGSIASALFLIDILILVSNRTRVQKWMSCMIMAIVSIVIEFFLMLGLILCIAYCSAYISLAPTNLDKDIIASLLAGLIAAVSIVFVNDNSIELLVGNDGQDRVHATPTTKPNLNTSLPLATKQTLIPRQTQNINGQNSSVATKRYDKIERATSPVDQRILNEFYADHPKDVHQYQLEGRQYVVYEGVKLSDIDTYRKELTQAMLLQEPQGLNEAINRTKSSIHATALAEEISQAENLANRLK